MPYKSIDDLPEGVRNALPKKAQEIFLKAFNAAWNEYGHDEEKAMKIAWGAVKKKYKKVGDKWVPKSGSVNNSFTMTPYMLMRGVAVSAGVYPMTDGEEIEFDGEVLNQIAERLKGVKIYADEHKKHGFGNFVGEVINSWVDGDKVMFDAEVVSSHYEDVIRKYPDSIKFSIGTKIKGGEDGEVSVEPFELLMTPVPRDENAELKEILNSKEEETEMDEKTKEEYENRIKELLNTIESYELEKKTAIAESILSMETEMGVEKEDSEVLLAMSLEELNSHKRTIEKFYSVFKEKEKEVLNSNPGSDVSIAPATDVGKTEVKDYFTARKEGLDEIEALKTALKR